jgi:GH35 family endo-1,4-beta-xylanase
MGEFMVRYHARRFIAAAFCIAVAGFTSVTFAGAQANQYSHRMRQGNLTVKRDGQAVATKEVAIKQIRNHFAFGAAIAKWPFDSAGAIYGETFKKYFQWATPENEQKWPYTDPTPDGPDYSTGDFLVDWCLENDIQVRGHNLFWNQSLQWVPEWMKTIAEEKNYTAGQKAVDDRIKNCMTHYKGKCAHWDILNEIVHGQVEVAGGQNIGSLKALTGREDLDIFTYVLKEARKHDPDAKFAVNDYNIVTEFSDRNAYITLINNIINAGGPIDIVGCEGHFERTVNISDFTTKLNDVANRTNREIWMTEVDFAVPIDQAAQKMEELMRACFAHQKVGGFIIWAPWEGSLWRDYLTSYLFDKDFNETAAGKKWRDLITEWTTVTAASTNTSGALTFTGYQGKYIASITEDGVTYVDTFYLEPGSGAKAVEVNLKNPDAVGVTTGVAGAHFGGINLTINGRPVMVQLPASAMASPLYLTTYSINGKLLSRMPLNCANGVVSLSKTSAGCHIYRISTANGVTLHTGRGMQVN